MIMMLVVKWPKMKSREPRFQSESPMPHVTYGCNEHLIKCCSNKWSEHASEAVKKKDFKVLGELKIPDIVVIIIIVVIDKRSKVYQIVIGVACSGDSTVEEKEEKKFKSIVADLATNIKELLFFPVF